jgi:hypothetical protein
MSFKSISMYYDVLARDKSPVAGRRAGQKCQAQIQESGGAVWVGWLFGENIKKFGLFCGL